MTNELLKLINKRNYMSTTTEKYKTEKINFKTFEIIVNIT